MTDASDKFSNSSQLTPIKRWLAWGSIVGGGLLIAAVVALVILGDNRYEFRLIATLLFGIVLIADGVLWLHHKTAIRNSRAWLRTRICANLIFVGASLSQAWLSGHDPRMGKAGIAMVAAFVLTMGMFFLVMLLSGASWRGDAGTRR